MTDIFEKNMAILARVNPGLYERLTWPVDTSIAKLENKALFYKVHQQFYHLTPENSAFTHAVGELLEEPSILIFGCENGYFLQSMFEAKYKGKIFVWERDPWLLRLLLSHHDFTLKMVTGKVRFFLGSALFDLIPQVQFMPIVAAHFFKSVYQNEFNILQYGLKKRLVYICTGTLFIDDLASAFQEQGFSVYVWDAIRLSLEESLHLFDHKKPDLVFSINYIQGITEFCAQYNVKYICWEIDPYIDYPQTADGIPDNSFIFSFRQKNLPQFLNTGFKNTQYLPLAANTENRRPLNLPETDIQKYAADISFVGSSMVTEAAKQKQLFIDLFAQNMWGKPEDARKIALYLFDVIIKVQSFDWDHYLIEQLCENHFHEFLGQDPEFQQKLYKWTMLLGETAASQRRLNIVERLIPYNIQVWGDNGWLKLQDKKLYFRGSAGHQLELTKIYNASFINLDINRFYQQDIVTMRVFDVLACGSFIIAEHSDALAELFKIGVEVESYASFGELEDKIKYYLKHREITGKIALKGCKAVLQKHTIAERLRYMLKESAVKSGKISGIQVVDTGTKTPQRERKGKLLTNIINNSPETNT